MKYTSKRLTVIFFLAHHFYPCALRALRSGAISDISLVYKRKFCLAAMRQASATCGGSRTFLLPPYKICASILKDLSALLRIL